MKLTQAAAASLLGLARSTVGNYDIGTRSDTKDPVIVPKVVLLACKAVENNLPPVGIKD